MLRLVADFVEEYKPSVWEVYGEERRVCFHARSVAEFRDLQDGIDYRTGQRATHDDDAFAHRSEWVLPSGWIVGLVVRADAPIGYEVTA